MLRFAIVTKACSQYLFNPITGEGGGNLTPPGLFIVLLKPFELLTYKFVTFVKYKFNMFSQIFRMINFC